MDATEEGGTIEIGTFQENSWLKIDICDDGQGVPKELRNRIFQPYFTTKATGTGLGLFVCRNIVEQNGGRIELTETSSTGTIFSVYFKLPDASPLPATGLVSVAETIEISAGNSDRIFPSS